MNTAYTSCSLSTDDEKKFVQDIISELHEVKIFIAIFPLSLDGKNMFLCVRDK